MPSGKVRNADKYPMVFRYALEALCQGRDNPANTKAGIWQVLVSHPHDQTRNCTMGTYRRKLNAYLQAVSGTIQYGVDGCHPLAVRLVELEAQYYVTVHLSLSSGELFLRAAREKNFTDMSEKS